MSQEDKNNITFEDDYDYLIIFNGYKGKIRTDRNKVFGFLQEPSGNINYDRNLHFYCSKVFCQDRKMFGGIKNIVEHPLFMFFSNHKNYNYKNFFKPQEKQKDICFFVSNISQPNNFSWTNHNYHKRLNFLEKILKTDLDIDIYGRGLQIKDSRYKGSPENKHDVLRKYKFSIAIENCCEKNYVSEKFFDCVLNDTVPIYYGSPNIHEVYNSECFLDLSLDKEPDKILPALEYENFIDHLKYAKNKYFNNYNIVNFINKVIQEE